MKLFALNSKPADPNGYIFQALVRALMRRSDLELVVLAPQDLAQVRRDPTQQALLVYGGEELHRIPAPLLQEPFARRAVWFTEDPYERSQNSALAARFDCVFTNDSGSVQAYPQAHHLPLAADPAFLLDSPLPPPTRLAFFSGTAWPNRKRLLAALIGDTGLAPDLDLHLVANAVVEGTPGERGLPAGLAFSAPIPITEFCRRAGRSLCTVVIGRDFSAAGHHAFARSPGPRLFEAGLSGSCQLVHSAEIPDMPADLQEGEHYLRFADLGGLQALLQEARVNPDRFRAIGAAMAARIQDHHTYDQRAAELVGALRRHEPVRLPVAPTPPVPLRVLFISHEQTRPGSHFGGAGLCLDRVLKAAPAHAEVRVLYRAGDDGHRFDLLDGSGAVLGGFRCKQQLDLFCLHHPEFEQQLEALLADWRPQLVHVNHIIGFTPAVFPLARRSGAVTLFTPWDYFVLCDSWNLLDAGQRFCDMRTFFDPRCQSCASARLPQFNEVDPLRRRVVMAEALTHVHHLIMPSAAAEDQIRAVFPHLPPSVVIEPVPAAPPAPLAAASGEELVVLVPGNLAPNKGYHDLRQILQQLALLSLPIRFRILGRVDAWIRRELEAMEGVELAGAYMPTQFAARAAGCDLALFLSPWPETYCITFDEWALGGRACFVYAIGALAEGHRHRHLHPGSRVFAPRDVDAVVAALVEACMPAGLAVLRGDAPPPPPAPQPGFGERHWQVFAQVLEQTLTQPPAPLPWQSRPQQRWVDAPHATIALPGGADRSLRARVRHLIYRLPGGHRAARLWQQLRQA